MTPIPLGMVFPDSQVRALHYLSSPPMSSRPLRVLCAHRTREGAQWQLRKQVTKVAMQHWQHFATVVIEEVSAQAFIGLLQQHSFVLCAQGGGLDPSPKAWLSLAHGAIPIIQKNALCGAYQQLPVAFVEDWQPQALNLHLLKQWRDDRAFHFDSAEGRYQLLQKLTLDYWWQQVLAALPTP